MGVPSNTAEIFNFNEMKPQSRQGLIRINQVR